MNIPKRSRTAQSGSVLVMVVVLTGLVGFTLASYLTLVKTQNLSSMRSQAWNATMPVIEAGLEEALTHLNKNGTNRLDIDGWTQDGFLYWIKRDLPTGFNIVTISNWWGPGSPQPIVESRGYVDMPIQVVDRGGSSMMASGSWNPASSGLLSRGVAAVARRTALFARGMVAKGQIDLNGNNIETDSFDSADPNHSSGGLYDPNTRKSNGHVATNSGLTNSLSIGNANIYGRVSTGPGGTVSYGSNGAVGDMAWHASGNYGIQPGWSADDMNVDFDDVDPPFGGGWSPGPGVVNGQTYDYVLGSGNYQMSNLSMSNTKQMIVTGNAVLYVTGNANLSGQAQIQIVPGGSLQLYVSGPIASLQGNGVINETGFAKNFRYFGLPSNTQLSVGGNGEFVGVIYAPQAAFSLSGGGDSDNDFIGASITDSVTMNGHFKFHYDEDLANLGPDNGYVINTWNEMNPTSVSDLPDSILIALGFINGTVVEAGDSTP